MTNPSHIRYQLTIITRIKTYILALVFVLALESPIHAEITKKVVAEINLARTQPKTYAKIIESRNGSRKPSKATREAIRFLKKAKPLSPLEYSKALSSAAKALVVSQGQSGKTGHRGPGSRKLRHRLTPFGKWEDCIGENIYYGSGSARDIVVALIIDEGVRDRGHRKNFFNSCYQVVGVAHGRHPSYKSACVMNFAGNFIAQ